MNTVIRKISVGREYPNGSIHYQVGSFQNLKHKRYKITNIKLDKELLELCGQLAYNIYVENVPTDDGELVNIQLWKTIAGVPVVVENDIDLD